MPRTSVGRPFVRDAYGTPIPGGSAIVDILNTAVANGAWTAITLSAADNMACKSISGRMRAGGTWLLSHIATGATYYTMGVEPLVLDISKEAGETLFYVNPTTTGTFEVMLLD